MANKFTSKAQSALEKAHEEARSLGHTYIGSEHILLGLIGEGDSVASKMLLSKGIDADILRKTVVGLSGQGARSNVSASDMTPRCKRIIEESAQKSHECANGYIGTEHILYGLSEEGTGIASKALEEQGITSTKIKQEIIELVGTGEPIDNPDVIGFTPRSKAVLEDALIESKRYGRGPIGTNHLLVGVMREADSLAARILYDLNANVQKLYENVTKKIDEDAIDKADSGETRGKGSFNSTPTLNQYGTDLTKRAEEGKLDPVIGRKSEIQRVIEILSRRTKNNPCLIGEPGVGKTAVIFIPRWMIFLQPRQPA